MPHSHLATYLRDHTAGAQAAIEIMDDIDTSYRGSAAAGVVAQVRPEIFAERELLYQLSERLKIQPSSTRRLFGWLSEKLVELKLRVDDPGDGPLRLLESLELLSIGISGKIALWNALDRCKDAEPALSAVDFQSLLVMARAQHARVETVRIEAAREAFLVAD
ncbi:MAG: hypothetical protein H7Z40_07875 [Phycisphaerae bacterium]|nr:hypothetical protein [Gemmatimonadaceae bacterium]